MIDDLIKLIKNQAIRKVVKCQYWKNNWNQILTTKNHTRKISKGLLGEDLRPFVYLLNARRFY